MIEVKNLSKSFGSHLILDDVSFRVETGESIVIIGRSGGGKSVPAETFGRPADTGRGRGGD